MKNTLLLLITISFLSSCNENKNKADANGNFESDATTISAESAGKLLSFTINEGDLIKNNTVVGVIDSTQLYLKKELIMASYGSIISQSQSVLSQINILEQQQQVQTTNLDRIKKMYSEGSATQKQFDEIQGLVNVTEQQISSVRAQNASVLSKIISLDAQVNQIDDQIQKCIIVNPIEGTVLVKYVEPFEFVGPGKPLYQIQNMNMLKLKAYIVEPQLSQIKIGQVVNIHVDSGKGEITFEGEITWISAQAEFTPKIIQTKDERKNLVYAIKIDVKNDGSLKIGMPASVYFK
ncbi:MAG: HlyD family efflux transporter periplasmic adaptor subunit [Bacteroidota bacterium]